MSCRRVPLLERNRLPRARRSIQGGIAQRRFLTVPRGSPRFCADWHRWKVVKLAASATEQQKAVNRVIERAAYREQRTKHWDLRSNRCRG